MLSKKRQSLGERLGKNGNTFSAPFFLASLIGILLVSVGLWFALGIRGDTVEEIVYDPIEVEVEYEGARHPLSGARVGDEDKFKLFAVMVENSQDAWPLSGIEDSYLVFEAPVEGNITRFMAMYSDDQDVGEIGPVRSARPYYVDIVLGLNALYAHVGGSPEALDLIQERGVWDFNEFFYGGSFWRSRLRTAPHNVYTSVSRLIGGWDDIVAEYQDNETRLFKEYEPNIEDRPDSHQFDVEFNGYGYDVTWEYKPEVNEYVRYQDGRKYTLKSGEIVSVKNVAIMQTTTRVIDSVGRQRIAVVGSGDATILMDGAVINGSWEKQSRSDALIFFDQNDNEIVWNVGRSWVQIVDGDRQVTLER